MERRKNSRLSTQSRSQRGRPKTKAHARAKPGTKGGGDYYHIVVRPKEQFETFRTHDVGREGHSKRVAGKTRKGEWATQKWLISKKDAHVKSGKLIADDPKTGKILKKLPGPETQKKGDVFSGWPSDRSPSNKSSIKRKKGG